MLSSITSKLEHAIFGHRRLVIALFLAATAFMAWSASRIGIDAGFAKLLPLEHPYMKTYLKHREGFGGANRLLIALMARDGDMFTPEFFDALKAATDEVFFIPGVDRTKVSSLFTPNTRFTEVVEDGISGGNVVPAEFQPTPEGLDQVRKNILKAGIVGRLVANDFSGAIISAQLLDINPNTGEPLDYIDVAEQVGCRLVVVVATRELLRENDAGHLPGRDLLLLALGKPRRQPHVLLTRALLHLPADRAHRLAG